VVGDTLPLAGWPAGPCVVCCGCASHQTSTRMTTAKQKSQLCMQKMAQAHGGGGALVPIFRSPRVPPPHRNHHETGSPTTDRQTPRRQQRSQESRGAWSPVAEVTTVATPHGLGPSKTRRAASSRSCYAKLLNATTSATARPPAAQRHDLLVATSSVTELTLTRSRRSANTHNYTRAAVTSLRRHQDNDAIGSQTKHKIEYASVANGASRDGFGGGVGPLGTEK
jgi:hypothetical protein